MVVPWLQIWPWKWVLNDTIGKVFSQELYMPKSINALLSVPRGPE